MYIYLYSPFKETWRRHIHYYIWLLRKVIQFTEYCFRAFRFCHKCVWRMVTSNSSFRNVSYFINNFIFKHNLWFTIWREIFLTVRSFRMLCLAKREQLSFNIYLDHSKTCIIFLIHLNSFRPAGGLLCANTFWRLSKCVLCGFSQKRRGGNRRFSRRTEALILLFLCKA